MRELLETYDSRLQYCPERKCNVLFKKSGENPQQYSCQYAGDCPQTEECNNHVLTFLQR